MVKNKYGWSLQDAKRDSESGHKYDTQGHCSRLSGTKLSNKNCLRVDFLSHDEKKKINKGYFRKVHKNCT